MNTKIESPFVQEIHGTMSPIENNKQPCEILSNSTSSITINKETENINAVTNPSLTPAHDLTSQPSYYKYLKVIVKKKSKFYGAHYEKMPLLELKYT